MRLPEYSTGREAQMSYVMINTECCSGKESGWFALEQATKAQGESTDVGLLFLQPRRWMAWVLTSTPRPLHPRERQPVFISLETGLVPGLALPCAENLAPTGIRFPDRATLNESLYQLSYPGPQKQLAGLKTLICKLQTIRRGLDEKVVFFI